MDEIVVIGDPFDNNDMDYVLENEEDPSSCEISEPTTRSAPTISENKIKGNEKGVTLGQDENTFDEPNFFTDHANVEKLVVESINFLPLSLDDFLAVPCDKEELCEIDSFSPMSQLVYVNNTHALEPYTSAANKVFIPIPSALDEQKILSSLNTLGYIEFHTLGALKSLKNKSRSAELSWLSTCTYHFVGKYNYNGEYRVHRVYIHSNLKPPFVV
jgi:hypothetical protein